MNIWFVCLFAQEINKTKTTLEEDQSHQGDTSVIQAIRIK